MRRLLIALLFLLPLAVGVVALVNRPGTVMFSLPGYEIETSFTVMASGVLLAGLALSLCFAMFFAVLRAPRDWRRRRAEHRRSKGMLSLMKGFTAVAAGDGQEAKRLVAKSERFLGVVPLTRLLAAQTAQLEGKDDVAQAQYLAMLDDREAEFLGLRGLLSGMASRPAGGAPDPQHLAWAERAYELRPKARWVVQLLLDHYLRLGRWQDAEHVAGRAARTHTLSHEESVHARALIHYLQAVRLMDATHHEAALPHLVRALRAEPGCIPAAVLEAELLVDLGQETKARRHLTRAWKRQAHASLVTAYAASLADLEPAKRLKLLESWLVHAPDSAALHGRLAEEAMQQGAWDQARNHARSALHEEETSGTLHRVRRVEEAWLASGSVAASEQGVVRDRITELRLREESALPDPRWVCESCHAPAERYQVYCGHCHGFDSLRWKQPLQNTVPLARGAVESPVSAVVPALA
jgi:HemY protein